MAKESLDTCTNTNIRKAIDRVLKSGQFILGKELDRLEKNVAQYYKKKYAIGVNSGTDALFLSLRALGITRDDEVITTPFTFIAPAEAIANCGARPIFVDIDYHTFLIDPLLIEREITEKTKAIIPVHLFGQRCQMEYINSIAKEYGLSVIEDGAQAFGTKGLGTGDLLCFSFHPSKSLGCCGDGGMILTDNKTLAEKLFSLRNHGADRKMGPEGKYHNVFVGVNSRLDEIQAAILREKLKTFKKDGIKRIYTFRTPNRNLIKEWLDREGIPTKLFYTRLLHLLPCFEYLGYKKGDFPVAEQATKEVLSINIYE